METIELRNITDTNNTLDGLNNILKMTENRIRKLGDRSIEFPGKKKKRLKTYEQSLRDLWDNNQRSQTCIIGVPEEKRKRVWVKECSMK